MNIIVCIKQVPDTTEIKIDPVKGTLMRDGVPSILNPDDANALEAALSLKDEYKDSKVHVVSMGPDQATYALRECLAMGADYAYLLSSRAFGGADTCATSTTIAAGIRKIGEFDLIFCGRQAIDGDTAQVGPQIAEKLDLPQVTYVQEFKIDKDLKKIRVKRALEDGYEEIEIETPCMLTAIKELNQPRYMNIKGIFDPEKKITTWNAADIEVDLTTVGLKASPTNVYRSFTPKPKGKGVLLEGDSEKQIAKDLIVSLKSKHMI